jgi:hypothetical protein
MPDAGRTREPCVQKSVHICARKQHRFSRTTGIPRAMVLTAAPRSPRCTGLFSHRRLAKRPARLDPSVGGTGPHGLTVRARAFVLHKPRPSHPASRPATIGHHVPRVEAGRSGYSIVSDFRKVVRGAADWRDGQIRENELSWPQSHAVGEPWRVTA